MEENKWWERGEMVSMLERTKRAGKLGRGGRQNVQPWWYYPGQGRARDSPASLAWDWYPGLSIPSILSRLEKKKGRPVVV